VVGQQPGSASVDVAEETVVLLGPDGEPIGERLKSEVHTTQTPLHLAFSLYLFDDAGQVLLTRRALGKRTWPGVWTNTCCGHPRAGESHPDAIRRRLGYELGMEVAELECVLPEFAYRAVDASGIVENEVCPVFWGRLVHPAAPLAPNPEEVMDWKWGKWDDVRQAMQLTPYAFSPWAVEQTAQLADRSA
jgi:isopentenyl-diphosphate delta-isomerase